MLKKDARGLPRPFDLTDCDVTSAQAQAELVADCLAEAFQEDPVTSYVLADSPRRISQLRRMFRGAVERYRADGQILLHPDGGAAAVWQAPSSPGPNYLQLTLAMLTGAASLRGAFFRALRVQRAMQTRKPAQPFWYLAMLGSAPALRGSGRAAQLMELALDSCDAQELPAYLESSNPDNVGYYRRFGFTPLDELPIPGGPSLIPMSRAARGGSRLL